MRVLQISIFSDARFGLVRKFYKKCFPSWRAFLGKFCPVLHRDSKMMYAKLPELVWGSLTSFTQCNRYSRI